VIRGGFLSAVTFTVSHSTHQSSAYPPLPMNFSTILKSPHDFFFA
jgi:hypothetical protein